jgi:hypothetical protein
MMSSEQQPAAFPSLELPTNLAANARALELELSGDDWALLDQDERYVLIKLGGGHCVKRNLAAALKEFLRYGKGTSLSSHDDSRQD